MALNDKQRRFVSEYLIDLNGTQAAIRAGYSEKTAGAQAFDLLKKPELQEALSVAMQAREKRTGITQDRVLQELAKIGFSDIRRVVRWGNTELKVNESGDEEGPTTEVYHGLCLTAADEIDDDTAAAIAEVSQGREGLKVKLYDKRAALVDIGRHLGMFKDKVELSGKDGGPIMQATVTAEELAEAVRNVRDKF
jgi:phage terminase small subunit